MTQVHVLKVPLVEPFVAQKEGSTMVSSYPVFFCCQGNSKVPIAGKGLNIEERSLDLEPVEPDENVNILFCEIFNVIQTF